MGPQRRVSVSHSAAQVAFEAVGPSVFAGWAKGGEVYSRCADNGCGCGFEWRYEPGELGVCGTAVDSDWRVFSGSGVQCLSSVEVSGREWSAKECPLRRQGFMRVLGLSSSEDADRIDV